MPDSKISSHQVNTAPTSSAALAGIDPGISSTTNYQFQAEGLKTWLGISVVEATTYTANHTLILANLGRVVEMNTAAAANVTVPPNSSVAFPVGALLEVVWIGAGAPTIVAGAGVTLRTAGSLTLRAQYSSITIRKRATDEWIVSGDTI